MAGARAGNEVMTGGGLYLHWKERFVTHCSSFHLMIQIQGVIENN